MSRIVDYAGLFPPAQLPMDAAVVNYDEYRDGIYSWMLDRFVVPTSRLGELETALKDLPPPMQPRPFSILVGGAEKVKDSLTQLFSDGSAITQFLKRQMGNASVTAIEMKLPKDVIGCEELEYLVFALEDAHIVRNQLRNFNEPPLLVSQFFEFSFTGSWRQKIGHTISVMCLAVPRRVGGGVSGGIKLRTGGTEASAFPSVEELSEAIIACRNAGVPFKCTAGLHHPFRRFDKSVNTKMHGFVNVFGGAALAYVHQLDEHTLAEILSDEDGHSFKFEADSFGWKDLRISRAELQKARRDFALSFGSCSFTEPIEDLQSWKLL